MPILDWRQLQNLNEQKQKGITYNVEAPVSEGERMPEEYWDVFDDELNRRKTESRDERLMDDIAAMNAYTDEQSEIARLANSGVTDYGAFRKDTDIPFRDWIENSVDYRANAQSGIGKLANGFAKMVPYAATTFLDNTVGLATGITNVLGDAVNGDGFHPVNSFIDTPFAESMQQIRDWSEKVFPNYRSTEEEADRDQWWKHLNANFWGDTFIKNLGFTIGAGLSGGLYAKGFQAMRGKVMRDAYRAAVAASIEGDTAAEQAFQRVLQGARQDVKSIYGTFNSIHDSYKRMGVMSQIIGGVGGAIGESRMEAMMAAKEMRDAYLQDADNRYELGRRELVNRITSNPELYDGFELTDAGRVAMEAGLEGLSDDYGKSIDQINKEADKVANFTFWLNMPLLTASNMVMFGRMFSGGYDTQARKLVKGTLGKYKGAGSLAGDIMTGLGNAATEGMEELSQKVFSEGTKNVADTNMAAFYNGKYDKNAIKTVSQWLSSMGNSALNVVADPTTWEEFAVGALTGALGMPSRAGWSGGIIGALQEGAQNRSEGKKYAEELNKITSDPKFATFFQGLVRHVGSEDIKNASLKDHDSFTWHGENDKQTLNWVMTFANAGMLNELEDYVDSFANVSLEEVAKLRSTFIDETDSDFQNKTDLQMQDWLKKRAFEAKKGIKQYRDFYDSVDFLTLGTSDKDVIDELVFTRSQLQNFEDRYNSLLDKVITNIKPTIEEISKEKDKDGNSTARAKRAQELLSSESEMRRLFGGYALDIKARSDENSTGEALIPIAVDDIRQEEVLKTLEDWGAFTKDASLKDDVKDIQKLVRSRQTYYAKLYDPSFRKKFNEESVKPEDVAEELEIDARKKKVDGYIEKLNAANNIGEYFDIMNSIDEDDPQTIANLHEQIDKTPKLAMYNQRIKDFAEASDELRDGISDANAEAQGAENIDALETVVEALDELDFDKVVVNSNPSDTAMVALGKELLAAIGSDEKARAMAMSILSDKIDDAAQALDLGPVNVAGGTTNGGETNNGGTEETNDGGSETSPSEFQNLASEINATQESGDSLLQKIVSGDFSGYENLTDDEKADLQALAKSRIDRLEKRAGSIATGKDDKAARRNLGVTKDGQPIEDEAKDKRRHEDFFVMDTNSLRGSVVSFYNNKDAKVGKKKILTTNNKGVNATIRWMARHGVQDFIDSGALAKLDEAYKKKGERLPIYFLGNPVYKDNNLENNPFVTAYPGHEKYMNIAPNIVLAVEMNERNREVLKAFENEKIFSADTLISVVEGEETKQYQVIGTVWNPTPDQINKMDSSEQDAYKNVKDQANKVWDYTFDKSILPQYKEDIDKIGADSFAPEGKWYVARQEVARSGEEKMPFESGERLYTTLNYIMSGRNEFEVSDKTTDKTALRDSLKQYRALGGKYHFALQTNVETIKTEDAPDFPSSIDAPAGSLWIATQEANGAWAWSYVSILTTDEFNFEDNKDTEFVKSFNAQLETIFRPGAQGMTELQKAEDFDRRLKACHTLSDMFYLGEGNSFLIRFYEGLPSLVVGGAACFNREDVIEQLKKGQYNFQIDIHKLDDSKWMNMMLNSGVLRSEMRSFVRMNASFGVNFLIDRDANNTPVKPYPKDQRTPVARTAGSEYANVWGTTGAESNIRIGNANYRIAENGAVYKMSVTGVGERVESGITIAEVTAISELLNTINHESLMTYPGKRYIAELPGEQYTELYERQVGEYVVHLQRRGTNGAIKLLYSTEEWNDLMSVAKPAAGRYAKEEKVSDAPTQQDLEAYDKQMAEEAGGTASKAAVKPKKKIIGSTKDRIRRAAKNLEGQQIQDAEKDELKKQEEIDCP
jgi:hypothetical protein